MIGSLAILAFCAFCIALALVVGAMLDRDDEEGGA